MLNLQSQLKVKLSKEKPKKVRLLSLKHQKLQDSLKLKELFSLILCREEKDNYDLMLRFKIQINLLTK